MGANILLVSEDKFIQTFLEIYDILSFGQSAFNFARNCSGQDRNFEPYDDFVALIHGFLWIFFIDD